MISSRISSVLLVLAILFTGALHAAQIEVAGKHTRTDGSVYDFQVVDGDALSPGDRFQIIIGAQETTYYAIVYVSRDGNAAQIFPPNNRAGRIKSGTRQHIPGIENYFTLDVNGGRELMFIVTSPNNISNLRSVLKNASSMTSSSQVYDYLGKRLPNVQKLEITNTGKSLTSTVDQVSSGLVRDLSATYAQNPWPANVSQDYAQQQRVRQGDDNSIPEAVRRRTAEVRSLLKRPAGATGSSSLRTVKVPDSATSATVPSTGEIRRDTAMLVAEKERQEEETRLRQTRLEEEERQRKAEIEAARLAQEQAEQEALRLQLQREEAERLEAQHRSEEEAVAKTLEDKRRDIAEAEVEAQRLAELRAEEERKEAERRRLEQERLEQIRLTEAARREEERRIAVAAEAERLRQIEAEREEAHRLALAAEEREEVERLRQLEEERREAERLALAEARRKEAARLAEEADAERQRRLEQERREAERLAAEEARGKEEERLAAEQAARQEADRQVLAAAEAEAVRLQQQREVAEQQRLEHERAEEQARLVAEQRAQELAERQAEEARRQAEIAAEEEQLRAEQLALDEKLRQQESSQKAGSGKAERKGFFGTMLELVNAGGDSTGDTEETGTVEERANSQTTTVVETDSTGEVVLNEGQTGAQPILSNQAAEAPREAVVVLQAPDRPAPKKLTAPAPVRSAPVTGDQAVDVSNREVTRDLYDQVASAIVSINTKNDPDAAGFILDSRGHILTAWHVINGVSDIGVNFMAISGAPRTFKARVIKYNKFQDLALLQLIDPPEGIQPITVAPNVLPDAGATVRVFGQKGGQVWATDDAVITRIAPHFTWFSKDNVIHRGEVLQVDLPQEGKEIGSLVTSMDYQMLGIKSFSGSQTGRTYAVSVRVIRDFIESEGSAAKQ